MASAFGIFLLRQTFKTVPKELDEAARVEGASALQVLWKVYVPLAKPVYIAYALVSVSYHWNNFLCGPSSGLNSVNSRPLTVGLADFLLHRPGIDWSIIYWAATLMTSGPLRLAFLLFSAPVRAVVHARPGSARDAVQRLLLTITILSRSGYRRLRSGRSRSATARLRNHRAAKIFRLDHGSAYGAGRPVEHNTRKRAEFP